MTTNVSSCTLQIIFIFIILRRRTNVQNVSDLFFTTQCTNLQPDLYNIDKWILFIKWSWFIFCNTHEFQTRSYRYSLPAALFTLFLQGFVWCVPHEKGHSLKIIGRVRTNFPQVLLGYLFQMSFLPSCVGCLAFFLLSCDKHSYPSQNKKNL